MREIDDLGDVCLNARGDLLTAICKLSVISSIDVDSVRSDDPDLIEKYRNLIYGIKEVVDTVLKDLYDTTLSLEEASQI